MFFQRRCLGVFFRQNSHVASDAPSDVQVEIVLGQGAVTIGGVEAAAFVADFFLVYQGDKAVGEALGDEELPAIFKTLFNTKRLPKGRAAPAQVNGAIDKPTPRITHQFRLSLRRILEMQPAGYTGQRRKRMIVLKKVQINTGFVKLLCMPAFAEETSCILKAWQRYNCIVSIWWQSISSASCRVLPSKGLPLVACC